jgi:hypothetical protein
LPFPLLNTISSRREAPAQKNNMGIELRVEFFGELEPNQGSSKYGMCHTLFVMLRLYEQDRQSFGEFAIAIEFS